jgi:hypothetical protein
MTMAKYDHTVDFYVQDFPRTLFPMGTNRVLVEKFPQLVGDFIYGRITHKKEKDSELSFLPQTRAYASKPGHHLRRTAKLDPVAEFFIYDLVYRNRSSFKKSAKKSRESFGYRFEKGKPISAASSYRGFKTAVHEALKQYKFCAKFDISSYFNTIYHHDLVQWFNDVAGSEEDAQFLDKFLKQTNSGRSIDCLPHGLYPTKMLGSHFLSFVDNANRLESPQLLRFMDDFYIFSDDLESVVADFIQVQRMLGEKGLSVNPAKTTLGDIEHLDIEREVDDIKLRLLHRRRHAILASGGDEDLLNEESEDEEERLDEEETEYLLALLKDSQMEEEDAELILALMRDYGSDVLEYLTEFLERFPNLSKNIFYFCQHVEDKEALGAAVLEFVKSNERLTEYQIFWLAKLLETQLLETKSASELLARLYEHPNGTEITRAKILEIPEKRFGMSDLREEQLRTGASNWPSWGAAVGSRIEKKANRNHLLTYFSNASPTNELIATCVRKL